MHAHDEPAGPKVYGIVAEYDDADALVRAATRAYKEGFRKLDAYSPFAIHGLAEAIGMRKTKIGLFTLIAGLSGAAGGFILQWAGSAWHYPYLVGGRDYFSWPAWIVITFECMILFSAFTCGISMLVLNGFPRPHHPIFDAEGFDRASCDRFFLCIEAEDERFDEESVEEFLKEMDPKPLNVSAVTA